MKENRKKQKISPNIYLVAKSMFRDYKKGDQIVDPEEVLKIMSCHEQSMVVKVLMRKL
jgi:hypothetical protein